MTIAERETFLSENPHLQQQIVSAPSIGDSARLGLRKPDAEFRSLLKKIKKGSPGSNINTF